MQHKVQVSVQYLEAIRMEAGGDQDDDIDLCCQSPKGTLRTDCGKRSSRSAIRLSFLAASVTVRPKAIVPFSLSFPPQLCCTWRRLEAFLSLPRNLRL